jgi:hypothetical protein
VTTIAEAGADLSRELLAEGVALFLQRLRDDPRFLAEMEYCGAHGIPHSVFLAWQRDDQDKALALDIYTRIRCSCGTFADEWIDADTGRTVDEQPYVAEAVKCFGCGEIDALMNEMTEAKADLDGIRARLRPFDPDRDDVDE